VLISIVKKRLNRRAGPFEVLKILSLAMLEHILTGLSKMNADIDIEISATQLKFSD
jgi:hypothetical protein